MPTRRSLLIATAAGLAAPAIIRRSTAATPSGTVVIVRSINDIVSGFDPAEAYEFSCVEACGNIYRRLIAPDPADASKPTGDLAEAWEVSKDGLVLSFRIRRDVLFDSGNPLTAEDVAFSLQRVVKLNKVPAFILSQFGWNADTVETMIRATSEHTLQLTLPAVQATTFVLYCLTANVGSVVEKVQVLANQTNGDLGNTWLRTHSAGASSYRLVDWRPNERVVLEANLHAAIAPRTPRVVYRHVPEPSVQLLTLQAGDADIARGLLDDQLKSIWENPEFSFTRTDSLQQMYLALNTGLPQFRKPQVWQAVKMAIDYDAIARNVTPKKWHAWQAFEPRGLPGAIADTPFKRDVAQARALLAAAGYADGFDATLDHANYSPWSDIAQVAQADLAEIGIKLDLIPGDWKQLATKSRARNHQMALMAWLPDYLDPNSNAQWFSANPDDSDSTKLKTGAWRCHFADTELTEAAGAAAKELDGTRRMDLYAKMQRDSMQRSPFVFLLQAVDIATFRKGVSGLSVGVLPDYTRYAQIVKV